jgi:hypothetical protein
MQHGAAAPPPTAQVAICPSPSSESKEWCISTIVTLPSLHKKKKRKETCSWMDALDGCRPSSQESHDMGWDGIRVSLANSIYASFLVTGFAADSSETKLISPRVSLLRASSCLTESLNLPTDGSLRCAAPTKILLLVVVGRFQTICSIQFASR